MRSKHVKKYFETFSVLPPKDVVVSSTTTPSGPESFETLLRAVAASSSNEFVVVVHGFNTGNGLYLKLANRSKAAVGAQTTYQNLETILKIMARPTKAPTADEMTKLELKKDDIAELIDVIEKVQAKKIKLVEFRGCNLGRNTHSVTQFRKVFGATSFGAPKLYSFFGESPIAAGSDVMGNHTSSHEGTTHTYTQTINSKTVHCCFGIDNARKPVNGHVVADDRNTLEAWVKNNFSSTATLGKKKALNTHGLWFIPEPKKIDLNDPTAGLFEKEELPRPIFPRTVGDNGQSEYQLHMVYSP
jgi:hypothetical protein